MHNTKSTAHPAFNGVNFIFFDLDDTLIDHKKAQERALVDLWSLLPQLHNIKPDEFTSTYSEINKRLWEAYRNNEIDRTTLKRRRLEQTFETLQAGKLEWKEVDKLYMDCYQHHWEWIDDAREAFVKLSRLFDVGVMTNGFIEVQEKKFKHFSLHRYSRHLIISEEVGYLKPDTRIFDYSAGKAGYDAGHLLYVGDSYNSDIIGGMESGWKTAWFTRDEAGNDDNVADFSFHHFSQLVEALTIKP